MVKLAEEDIKTREVLDWKGLHTRLNAWYERLQARPEFAREIAMPPPVIAHFNAGHQRDVEAGKTLELVAGL